MTIQSNYEIDDVRPPVGEQPKPAWADAPNYEVRSVPVRDPVGRFVGFGFETRHDASAPQFLKATDPPGLKRDIWTNSIVYDAPSSIGPHTDGHVRPSGEAHSIPTPEQRTAQAGVLRERLFSRTASEDDLIELAVSDESEIAGMALDLLLKDDKTGRAPVELANPLLAPALDAWAARNPSAVIDLAGSPMMEAAARDEAIRWASQLRVELARRAERRAVDLAVATERPADLLAALGRTSWAGFAISSVDAMAIDL